jgi:hypothetical protein
MTTNVEQPWRIRPSQIRAPRTIAEAEESLRVVAASLAVLGDKIGRYEDAKDFEGVERCRTWVTEWREREAQLRYALTLLRDRERTDNRVFFLLDRLCLAVYALDQGGEWVPSTRAKLIQALQQHGGSYERWVDETLPKIIESHNRVRG